uniref:Uncharacterized protein n=1 Tax=Anguilla anguilla TaxID=7936 RepID=A0A0E9XPR0_ANGAN
MRGQQRAEGECSVVCAESHLSVHGQGVAVLVPNNGGHFSSASTGQTEGPLQEWLFARWWLDRHRVFHFNFLRLTGRFLAFWVDADAFQVHRAEQAIGGDC